MSANLKNLLLSAALFFSVIGAKAQVVMNIDATSRGPLTSPYQYGLFFEEINHAGDGGLYAELVQNRSFDEGLQGWVSMGGVDMSLTDKQLLNEAQKQALKVTVSKKSKLTEKGIRNEGFWGMGIVADSTYTFSMWVKGDNVFSNQIIARLVAKDGTTSLGETMLTGNIVPGQWNKLTATIKATTTDPKGQLALLFKKSGTIYVDMVSLFPYTWRNRPNGLRPDLAQRLYDTHPTFLRFPGGCYVEGEGTYDNAFQWKKTIGPVEQRPGHLNRNWRYYSTDGLGYDEYLQLCEDLGAAPLFVVNVGLGHGYTFTLDETKALVQDALDAIEYANGDATTTWGARRIANGHPEPYHLKFVEIGNENYQSGRGQQSEQYAERYNMFYTAIKEKYPDIITIGNVESWGTDNPSWRNYYPVELVDEHYYRSFSWMRDNYRKYDNYSRDVLVYNGEYAANQRGTFGRYGTISSALGEAIYMLGMERNSDVCRMASFAPIFMHESDPRWDYDMIHFNAASHFVTPSYYVQQMMASNVGHQNLKWTETGNMRTLSKNHQVALATWNTKASFDDVSVTAYTGSNTEKAVSDDFAAADNWKAQNGKWKIDGAAYKQTGDGELSMTVCNKSFTADKYIYNVRAKKDDGAEGFLVVFDYQDAQNYTWWNIGGWNNTQHAVEMCQGGAKTTVVTASGKIEPNRWYDLRVEVGTDSVRCFIDNNLVHAFPQKQQQKLYQCVQLDEQERTMILKVVNPDDEAQPLTINLKNMRLTGQGTVQRLAAVNGNEENTMSNPERVSPTPLTNLDITPGNTATLQVPPYSLCVYRLPVGDVAAEVVEKPVEYPAYKAEDEGKCAYLFSHMNRHGEFTSYALSKDGKVWDDIMNGAEVMDTKRLSVTGGMRDSYVCRMENGQFMMVATDMTSRLGWTSNHIMNLLISPDLVHWTKNVNIDLESKANLKALGGITAEQMTAAWAPQVIYDRQTGKYVLYYSVGFPDRHRIYYQLIDEQLNILTPPRVYFDPGYDIIDADIVWNEPDQQYVMVYKCEKTRGFDRATATQLVPSPKAKGTTVWTVTQGWHVGDNGNQNIEAITMWRPIGSDKWKLSYQNYGTDYGYKTRDMDIHCLEVGTPAYMTGKVAAQHGSILKLTQQEYDFLCLWGETNDLLSEVRQLHKETGKQVYADIIAKTEKLLSTIGVSNREYEEMIQQLKKIKGS